MTIREEEAEARQEPVLALVLLSGIAAILSLTTTDTLLDYPTDGRLPLDVALLPVIIFIQGALYGAVVYWLGGGAVHLGLRGAGAEGRYRLTRHLLAFAAAPLALGLLVLLPLRLAAYGGDAFRTGGGDDGAASTGGSSPGWSWPSPLWAAGLLVYGIKVVYGWSVPRVLGSLALGRARARLYHASSR